MIAHSCFSFYPALRGIVPNLPADHVTKCVITVDVNASPDVIIELTMFAMDEAGNPLIEGIGQDQRIRTETKRFRIVPDEEGQA